MILSKIKVAVSGSNRTRLLNKLKDDEVHIFNLQTDVLTTFWVWEKDKKKVIELADIMGVSVEFVSNSGMGRLLQTLLSNAPYIIAVTICAVMIAVSMMFVFDTKVIAQDDVYGKKVQLLLQENNIDGTILKSKVDLRQIENLIVSTIDEVSFATCYLQGYSLVVQIVTTDKPKEIAPISDLKSDFDAVVTRVIVRSGTSEVVPGQRVNAGDILIGGYHIADNTPSDGEESGERIEVAASGEVYGRVYTHQRFVIPMQTYSFVKTGASKVIRDLGFNSWKIFPDKKVPYEFYEKQTNTINLFGILPIRVTTCEYYELKKVAVSENTYIENLKKRFETEFIASLNLDAKLLAKNYVIKEIDGTKYLDIFYETERRIDSGGNDY